MVLREGLQVLGLVWGSIRDEDTCTCLDKRNHPRDVSPSAEGDGGPVVTQLVSAPVRRVGLFDSIEGKGLTDVVGVVICA